MKSEQQTEALGTPHRFLIPPSVLAEADRVAEKCHDWAERQAAARRPRLVALPSAVVKRVALAALHEYWNVQYAHTLGIDMSPGSHESTRMWYLDALVRVCNEVLGDDWAERVFVPKRDALQAFWTKGGSGS